MGRGRYEGSALALPPKGLAPLETLEKCLTVFLKRAIALLATATVF